MTAKISVIIAAYNVERFIDKCVNSALAQTYKDLEILLIDDGSTDQTPEICDKLAKKSEKVRVIHQKNQGLSAVRNRGIEESTGDFLVFLDGDDYLATDFVNTLYENMQRNGTDIAMCGFKIVPVRRTYTLRSEVMTGEEATRHLLTEQETYQIVSWNKLYKKSLFKDVRFPVGKRNEDSLTTYKVLSRAYKVSQIESALYYYSQRDDSIMGTIELKERLDMKLLSAVEAKEYFRSSKKLTAAAEICELLAYLSFIDNILARRLELDINKYFNWIRKNAAHLKANQYLSKKLRIYIFAITHFKALPYRIFRRFVN